MKLRVPLKITSRTSSITNSFVQAIIPDLEFSNDEQDEALSQLGLTRKDLRCVYCGNPTTDWDHLRPLVKNRRPTGFVSEIRNLVPACGPCNQSKGASDWRVWMTGNAPGSPATRGIKDIEERAERISHFETWGEVKPFAFDRLVPSEIWDDYWSELEAIVDLMKRAQEKAAAVRNHITEAISAERRG